MNKHGQSLVTFVLILPLLVLFIALMINTLISLKEKNKLEGIIKNNLEIVLKDNIQDQDKIKSVIKANDQNIEVIIKIDNNDIQIKASNQKNMFSNLLGNKLINLQICYNGNYQNKRISKCE